MAGRTQVVDASVAVEWFAPVDDATGAAAFAVLAELRDEPRRFVAPELFFHEVHAVLCRKLSRADQVTDALRLLWGLGMGTVPWEPTVAAVASNLAFRWGLSGYDANYLAVAKIVGGEWVTFDRKAHQRVSALRLSRVPSTPA